MTAADPEQFSPAQRLYVHVHASLAAKRWAAELEAGKQRIEADPGSKRGREGRCPGETTASLKPPRRAKFPPAECDAEPYVIG